ncbi:Integrin alpha-PS5 [Eumeta japonica]|uniref:Integrin alpha-PS5 n=1 Tax=Eumeta variegata TaxID=151549 RepID=A0A4C1UKD1_EUMVA|nr:Integrin alpha-PS5 [Eumeta japonica]
MSTKYIGTLMFVSSCLVSAAGDVPLFHENSKTVFRPTSMGGYFGYTVLLKQGNPFELLVGAPKAASAAAGVRPGALYRCALAPAHAPANGSCALHAFSSRLYGNIHRALPKRGTRFILKPVWESKAESGPQSRAGSGVRIESGIEMGIESRFGIGIASRIGIGIESGIGIGTESRFGIGTESGIESGIEIGIESRFGIDTESRIERGIEIGVDSRFGIGTESGIESRIGIGIESRFGIGIASGIGIGIKSGIGIGIENRFGIGIESRFGIGMASGIGIGIESGIGIGIENRFGIGTESEIESGLEIGIVTKFGIYTESGIESGSMIGFESRFGIVENSHGYISNYFKDDMWLGASLTTVTEDSLLVNIGVKLVVNTTQAAAAILLLVSADFASQTRAVPVKLSGPRKARKTGSLIHQIIEKQEIQENTDKYANQNTPPSSEDEIIAEVCAPRWTTPYGRNHLLANGLCFLESKEDVIIIAPLSEGHQAYITDGKRKEYGEYGLHLNYYAYAQAGMSAMVSEDRSSLLLGAPGLLQWTGGVVQYQLLEGKSTKRNRLMRPVSNPYFTLNLHPDDYFEQKLKVELLEFKTSKELCDTFASNRNGNENSTIFKNNSLKSELAEMNIKCDDLSDQRLQLVISEMNDCRQQILQDWVRQSPYPRVYPGEGQGKAAALPLEIACYIVFVYITFSKVAHSRSGYSVESGVFEPGGETLYVAGAPRGAAGRGRVLIFRPSAAENVSLTIMGRLDGPQLGAYFGASLLCADLNADGRADVLVGAPNYVSQNDKLFYDQGAVYVYLSEPKVSGFGFRAAGSVRGSGASGARFGSALAALGDVDGDGHPEVAVGAPWEEGGRGAVYVYSAHEHGLRTAYVQRISPSGARAFGIAISKGLDIDGNGCNDLAVGAHVSDEVYVFRCAPTITMMISTTVPGALEQPQNATNFTALFCIQTDPAPSWPTVRLELNATILVDNNEGRAYLNGRSNYKMSAAPGLQSCEQRMVVINRLFNFSAEPSLFSSNEARLSDNSVTHSLFQIQLTGDCGEDLICQPELVVQLKDLGSSPYIPGSGDRMGVVATVINAGEPAYGAVVNFSLPAAPKRVPSSCEMFANNMTCKVPSPLNRGENASYTIELAYVQKDVKEEQLNFTAEIKQPLNTANETQSIRKLTIEVVPIANMTIKGKVLPNATLHVTREQLSAGALIKFVHYFEVTNFGPSDWPYLDAEFNLADWASLSSDIRNCAQGERKLNCSFDIPAHVSFPITLPLTFDLKKDGNKLEENGIYEATTVLILKQHNMNASLTTRLVLRAAPPLWPLVVGGVAGLLLLAIIVYVCYKCGFFRRNRRLDEQETEHIIQEDTSRRDSEQPPDLQPEEQSD